MKSVAIYGFSTTRDLISESNANEVWTLNDAYKRDVPIERVTRWYEMHRYPWIPKDHMKWLRRKHPFPVYMLRHYKSFPASIAYPLADISAKVDLYKNPKPIYEYGFVYNRYRIINSNTPIGRLYFTNSIAYMVAHAIANDYNRIELYGVDMRQGTEYEYQKACTEYMLGVAIGRGIDVFMPPECALLNAPLYSYDADGISITEDILKLHMRHYQSRYSEFKEPCELSVVYDGAQGQIRMLLEHYILDSIIPRQTIEIKRVQAMRELQETNSKYNYIVGWSDASGERHPDLDEAYQKMYMLSGAVQALRNIMLHIDMKPYSLDLSSKIMNE